MVFSVPNCRKWRVLIRFHFMLGIVAAVITVFIQMALGTSLEPSGLPFMTLPFCLAALSFVVIQGTLDTVISVPLSSMTTPEDHMKRIRKLSAGFDLLHGAISSASYSGSTSRGLRQRLVSVPL